MRVHLPGRRLCVAGLLSGAVLLLNWGVLHAFWLADPVAGFDGTSHAVVGEYYSRAIFPSTWGWMPHWFGGMPFPQFYPPLFYLLTAALAHSLPVSYSTVLKAFVTALLLALPPLSAWTAGRLFHERHARVTAGAFAVFFLTYGGPGSEFGISVSATLRSGLFTQLLGYVCLLAWLGFFLPAQRSASDRYASCLLLFLTLLANVHVVPVVAVVCLVSLVWRIQEHLSRREAGAWKVPLADHAMLVLVPLAGAAFWYLPLAAYYDYLATMALPSLELQGALRIAATPVALTVVAWLSARGRKNSEMQILATICLLTAGVSIVPSARLLGSMPIQPFRFFAVFLFLAGLPASYAVVQIVSWLATPAGRAAAWVVLMTPLGCALQLPRGPTANDFGFVAAADLVPAADLRQIPPRAGIATVEVYTPSGRPSHFVLNALLAKEGFDTTYSVFRESAISSVFMTPLRNGLSELGEAWGVDTFLAFDPAFLGQRLDRHLDRARFVGVDRFWVASDGMKRALAGSSRVRLQGRYGQWSLFEFREPAVRGEALAYEPTVFFGPASFKKRAVGAYELTRFQEELLFRGAFDTIIVRANDPSLDTSADLVRFKSAIISDYEYDDIALAFERLERFSRDHLLICVERDDPLFRRLRSLAKPHRIVVVGKSKQEAATLLASRNEIQAALQRLADERIPISQSGARPRASVAFEPRRIHVSLQGGGSRSRPVLIKASYFPSWRRSHGDEPVYMASPSFMLTFADADFDLIFSTPAPVLVGRMVSGIAFLVVFAGAVKAATARGRGDSLNRSALRGVEHGGYDETEAFTNRA